MSNYGSHAPPSYNFSRTLKGGEGVCFFPPSLLIFFMFLHKGNNLSYDRLLSPKLPLTYVQYMDLGLAWHGMAWLVPPPPYITLFLHFPISPLSSHPRQVELFSQRNLLQRGPCNIFFLLFFPLKVCKSHWIFWEYDIVPKSWCKWGQVSERHYINSPSLDAWVNGPHIGQVWFVLCGMQDDCRATSLSIPRNR